MTKKIGLFLGMMALFAACQSKGEQAKDEKPNALSLLKVSDNGRFLATKDDNEPFFWLGDTGWLLFTKLNREQADQYLENRKQKGFNVIQVMVLHTLGAKNVYGDSALVNKNVATTRVENGDDPTKPEEYDFWNHVDYVIDKAAEKGIYMALVPIWGSNVKSGKVKPEDAKLYAEFLANRYKNRKNIIWLNGGDIKGSDGLDVWQAIGTTLREKDPNHLITYHPRGRYTSSDWFHTEKWMDFNMVQSGHRTYAQDTSRNDKWHHGEDNWRFIQADYARKPVKPVIDGEPSYEGIPHGLHDVNQPRWTAADVRRYGYWSVLAGAFGYTYGDNEVMQMHRTDDTSGSSYGPKLTWDKAVDVEGAGQMIHLKNLLLSKSYFDRVPDQSLVADQGERYNYLTASRGTDYALVYTYTGRTFRLNMGKIPGAKVKASWYSPRDGKYTEIGEVSNQGVQEFNPPGEPKDGNDWVLVIDKV